MNARRILHSFVPVASSAVALAAASSLSACGRPADRSPGGSDSRTMATIMPADARERAALVARARVWTPTKVESMDILAGPTGSRTWRVGETIACTFQEPDKADPLSGRTEKFNCVDTTGDSLKIKYGLRNGEIPAEIAASRLLWVLGFASDRNYPVRVECKNCPKEPWTYIQDFYSGRVNGPDPADARRSEAYERGDRLFIPALMEKKYSGEKIEMSEDQGWAFSELLSDPALDPTERVRREALVLLMGVLQHADSKAEQQRLICPKDQRVKDATGRETCRTPVLVVHDLGWTFGSGWRLADPANISKMDLEDWRDTGVWSDPARCVVRVNQSPGGSLGDTRVSRAARDFLAGLLGRLTRAQKEALFRAARVELQYPVVRSVEEGNARVRAWADVLDAKIAAIKAAPCDR